MAHCLRRKVGTRGVSSSQKLKMLHDLCIYTWLVQRQSRLKSRERGTGTWTSAVSEPSWPHRRRWHPADGTHKTSNWNSRGGFSAISSMGRRQPYLGCSKWRQQKPAASLQITFLTPPPSVLVWRSLANAWPDYSLVCQSRSGRFVSNALVSN